MYFSDRPTSARRRIYFSELAPPPLLGLAALAVPRTRGRLLQPDARVVKPLVGAIGPITSNHRAPPAPTVRLISFSSKLFGEEEG
eukprot:COSAG04_NODE_2630_length_3833_cov_1.806642_2_plen_85_part_00